jgi:hypothetical protein
MTLLLLNCRCGLPRESTALPDRSVNIEATPDGIVISGEQTEMR